MFLYLHIQLLNYGPVLPLSCSGYVVPLFLPSRSGCLSPLSFPGVVAMAREPAQMAGQLAFRGRAPQLKTSSIFLFSSSLLFSSNFWLATFHAWRAFISPCMMWAGEGAGVRDELSPRSIGAIGISSGPAQGPTSVSGGFNDLDTLQERLRTVGAGEECRLDF